MWESMPPDPPKIICILLICSPTLFSVSHIVAMYTLGATCMTYVQPPNIYGAPILRLCKSITAPNYIYMYSRLLNICNGYNIL